MTTTQGGPVSGPHLGSDHVRDHPAPELEQLPRRRGHGDLGVPRTRQRALLALVTVAFVVYVWVLGPPSGREIVLMWVLLWLFAAVGGSLQIFKRVALRDWMPFIAVLFGYDFLRGQVQRLPTSQGLPLLQDDSFSAGLWHAHVLPVLRADVETFGRLPTVWLQERLHPTEAFHWYDVLLAVVYMSHFVLPLVVALLLWSRAYHAFHRYIATLTVVSVLGLATYMLFPAAPPWMASLNGYTAPGIERLMGQTLKTVGSTPARSVIERGEAWSNPVAAMPSLHAAMPMMILLFFWASARWWMRSLLALYTLAMGFALVYGGEHYVVDIVFGWLYAAAAYALVVYAVRLRARRRRAQRAVAVAVG